MKTVDHVDPDPRPFGPGSRLWDEFGDVMTHVFSGGAFMLQVMHPTIATVVDIHSEVFRDPVGRALRNTDSIVKWIYGGEAALAEGRRLLALHAPMQGIDAEGQRYRALDPEAYGWVHATAFVTAVTIYPYIHGRRMTPREQEAYYDEMLHLGAILRIRPAQLPATVADYWEYYDTMVADRLSRTKVADKMLTMLGRMPIPAPVPRVLEGVTRPVRRAAGEAALLFVLGGMTPSARERLGVTWTPMHERSLRGLMSLVRPVHARLPESLRYVPLARHARAHARALEAIERRARAHAPPARPIERTRPTKAAVAPT